jgi:hypothetical protein
LPWIARDRPGKRCALDALDQLLPAAAASIEACRIQLMSAPERKFAVTRAITTASELGV